MFLWFQTNQMKLFHWRLTKAKVHNGVDQNLQQRGNNVSIYQSTNSATKGQQCLYWLDQNLQQRGNNVSIYQSQVSNLLQAFTTFAFIWCLEFTMTDISTFMMTQLQLLQKVVHQAWKKCAPNVRMQVTITSCFFFQNHLSWGLFLEY